MKNRISLLIVLIFVLPALVTAQSFKLGFRAGATLNKISGVSFTDEFKFGYHVGAAAEAMWSKHWGIQPEVYLTQSNSQTATRFDQLYQSINPTQLKDVKLNYLSIPVLLNWRPLPFISFQSGPQFSILMSKDANLLQNGTSAFKSGNVSLLGGVQVNIIKMRFYGRYGIGLSNINNINVADRWESRTLQIGAGFVF